jgi:hypothetical protein
MTMPNFLVIGASRSGTTSLYQYLKQHPQIYMCPVKEPSFFAFAGIESAPEHPWRRHIVTDFEAYQRLFQDVTDQIAIGDVSPAYLNIPEASKRIQQYVPGAKLVVILRDPVGRAYSEYLARVMDSGLPFTGFAKQPPEMFRAGQDYDQLKYRYIRRGFYHDNLKRYFDAFDRDQIKVYLYKDFKDHPLDVLHDLFRFLGVDETFVPDTSIKHGKTGIPKNKTLHMLIELWYLKSHSLRDSLRPFLPAGLGGHLVRWKNKNLVKPQLPLEVRQEWIQVYREDILQLQDLIGCDLSVWLE